MRSATIDSTTQCGVEVNEVRYRPLPRLWLPKHGDHARRVCELCGPSAIRLPAGRKAMTESNSLVSALHSAGVREDILAALREAGAEGLRKETIVTVAHTSRTSAHRHLTTLRERGKVERYKDPDDGRAFRYRLRGERE